MEEEIPIPTWQQVEDAALRRGLKITRMCRRADIDPQTFTRWKKGIGTPAVATVQKMKDAIMREPLKSG